MNDAQLKAGKVLVRLLRFVPQAGATATFRGGGMTVDVETTEGVMQSFPAAVVEGAVSLGLLGRNGARLLPEPAARSFLRRAMAEREEAYLAQHGEIATASIEVGGERSAARLNLAESPLGALARIRDRKGDPFLPERALAAGERLLADFTRGQLQPRVTSSWEPRLASRAHGQRGGMAELTDSAVAARLSVNRAIEAMGPELAGVALDICCFMKGLETVERERQWPARSAKLMLRTALLALSRHYDPPRNPSSPPTRHWGVEGFCPEL